MDFSPSGSTALPSSAGFWRAQARGSLRPAPPPCGCYSLCFALFSGAGPLCRGDTEGPLILPGPEQTALSARAGTGRAEGGPREQAASAPRQCDHRAPASDGSCIYEKAWDTSAHGHTDTHTQAVCISPLFVDLHQGHWGFSSSRFGERGEEHRGVSTTPSWRAEAAAEQDGPGLAVLDEEEEGPVGTEPGHDPQAAHH